MDVKISATELVDVLKRAIYEATALVISLEKSDQPKELLTILAFLRDTCRKMELDPNSSKKKLHPTMAAMETMILPLYFKLRSHIHLMHDLAEMEKINETE